MVGINCNDKATRAAVSKMLAVPSRHGHPTLSIQIDSVYASKHDVSRPNLTSSEG